MLVLDDDAAIREVLSEVLEEEGYQVKSAANGREGLQILRANDGSAGLILLDLMMPIMNGWDFRALQLQDPALATIPVVVLSADRDIRLKAASISAHDYLAKPVDLNVLVEAVRRHYPNSGEQTP
ncbi:MAG: response regulator [Oscillochloris sp.]|nr:response regulator [Oscillochloris sp.]